MYSSKIYLHYFSIILYKKMFNEMNEYHITEADVLEKREHRGQNK